MLSSKLEASSKVDSYAESEEKWLVSTDLLTCKYRERRKKTTIHAKKKNYIVTTCMKMSDRARSGIWPDIWFIYFLVYMAWCGLRGTTELQGCQNRVVLGPEDSVWIWILGVIVDVFWVIAVFWVWCSMQKHVAPRGMNFYSYPVLIAAWKQTSWLPTASNIWILAGI